MNKLFIAIVSIVAVFLTPRFLHDFKLNRLENRFTEFPRDSFSNLAASYRKVGLLHNGNSNNCSYLVGELRSYSGSLDEIELFYKNKSISSVGTPDRSNPTQCELKIFPVDRDFILEPKVDLDFFDAEIFSELKNSIASRPNEKFFFLHCADTMYPSGFDFRCM